MEPHKKLKKVIYIERCPLCKGKGNAVRLQMYNANVYSGFDVCPKCNGKGMIRKEN